MAALSNADQAVAYAAFVGAGDSLAIVKAELRAAVTAVDAWVDANAASFNAAIPQPARGALTARQKARLLEAVIRRRSEIS